MKVIDLLNKIANGEEVPKEIKLNDNVFIYDGTDDNEFNRYRTMTDDFLIDEGYLSDEIEIIEEDKNIKRLPINDGMVYATDGEMTLVVNKINEIIDKINKIEE